MSQHGAPGTPLDGSKRLKLDQVGSSCLVFAQVGPSWPQDASMLAPKSQKITGTHLPRPPKGKISSMFDQKLLFLEHPESSKD